MFYVELVWNREFHFVQYGKGHQDLEGAIKFAQSMEELGDGAVVKKTRVVDSDGEVCWDYGKVVLNEKET